MITDNPLAKSFIPSNKLFNGYIPLIQRDPAKAKRLRKQVGLPLMDDVIKRNKIAKHRRSK